VTEIRLDVELAHPPERVWRAIAHARVGFVPAQMRPVVGSRFRLEPRGQTGFADPIDGEVLEVDPPRRLVMRWRAPELDAKVSVTMARLPGGCRLTLRQSGFFGMQGLLQRRVIHRVYTELLGRRLPDALDQLAADEGARSPFGAALARRRQQRARTRAGTARTNAARRFPSRMGLLRRRQATGRVRVSRPLNLEVTLPFALAGAPLVGGRPPAPEQRRPAGERRQAAHSRPRRTPAAHERRAAHGRRPAHGRRAAHGRPAARPEWLLALRGRVLRAWETAGPWSRRGWAALAVVLGQRRYTAVVAAAGLLLAIGTVSLIVVGGTALYPARPPQVGGGPEAEPGLAELPGRPHPSEVSQVSRIGGASAGGAGANAAANPVTVGSDLVASYRTESVRLGGYRSAVSVTNPSRTAAAGWTVVITLPVLNLTVRGTAGAEYRQEGRTVTFTPIADTKLVGPGASVLFTFEVDGVGSPTGCTVDGRPCAGIPG
jgi:uncharacterized protein YndB with AHSA1/START domain